MGRERAASFAEIDETQASGILTDVLREANVYLGGSSMGKGLKKAARYYLNQTSARAKKPAHFELPDAKDINEEAELVPLEEPFYIVDIGVVVSQVYQWRRFFPRVEPFYAVKCNPDPVIVKTLAILGCNFDCASRNEIRLVQELTRDLPRKPEIIFANPCKPRAHLLEAVCKGVKLVTFDNATEVQKCATISKSIELILRIITDDRGSQCRLSSKFGAPRNKWRPLLAAAKNHGLQVVGVSFHVGSGCRDASRYAAALRDAREIFDIANSEFDMDMKILDIGGGFPGETHSIWNPAVEIDDVPEEEDEVENELEGAPSFTGTEEEKQEDHFMFFKETAEQVAPIIDNLFPPESGVRIISEPGRFFVAASATLCCSVVSSRSNEVDNYFLPEPVDDKEAAKHLDDMTREDMHELVRTRGQSLGQREMDGVLCTIQEELADYSKLFASQQLAQQEVNVYNDSLDLYKEGFETSADLLGPPETHQKHRRHHTVEGMTYPLIAATKSGSMDEEDQAGGLITLAAAGEAAINGVVIQAVADSAPLQDDFAYYINDGVYGAFNNIMFDHATVRPRVLRATGALATDNNDGFESTDDENGDARSRLYSSTVFGPTCDSIDVIARSVLLPKLKVGDWVYFENMGAYTMAASSSFNGFTPSDKFYVCSVQPEYFEALISGPESENEEVEEKKEDREIR